MSDQHRLQSVSGSNSHDGISSLLAYFLLSIFLCLCPALLHPSQKTTNILILKSGTASFYDSVVDHINIQLEDLCTNQSSICNATYNIQSINFKEVKPALQQYELVITLGLKARWYALNNLERSNMIHAMIPSGSGIYSPAATSTEDTQIIMLDQPFERSLNLIRKIIPDARQIGILISSAYQDSIDELRNIGKRMGLVIHPEIVRNEDEIGRKLSYLLEKIDVLLAQPDINIHNRKTVSKILLSSYRKKIPVIGFSSAYVKAGALAAVFSSPEDIGKHIGESIASYLSHGKLVDDIIFPRFFSISINRKVRHSLGIKIDSEPDDIAKYIRDNEK